MTAETAFAIVALILGLVFIGWVLSRLFGSLNAELDRQQEANRHAKAQGTTPPYRDYPLVISLVLGLAIVVGAIAYTGDPRAGFRLGMAGLVIAWAVQAGVAKIRKR